MKRERGAGPNNIHIHHINGRKFGINDYLTVPLIGYAHSWRDKAYHNMTDSEFQELYGLSKPPKEYFKWLASIYLHEWYTMGNKIPLGALKDLDICFNCKWLKDEVCTNGDSDSCTEIVDMFDDCEGFER